MEGWEGRSTILDRCEVFMWEFLVETCDVKIEDFVLTRS